MTKEPQSTSQALFYLLTYAYSWGWQDITDINKYKKQPYDKRPPVPVREPDDPALASIIHTIRLWASLPETRDSDTIQQAIETLRVAGVIAVPE